MNHHHSSYQWRKQLLWGLILIATGTVFLLDRMGMLEVRQFWHYWPLLLVLLGLNQVVAAPSRRHASSGLWLVVVGLWLFANLEGLFDLDFHNSWPLLLIGWGVITIVEPFIPTRTQLNQESQHEA